MFKEVGLNGYANENGILIKRIDRDHLEYCDGDKTCILGCTGGVDHKDGHLILEVGFILPLRWNTPTGSMPINRDELKQIRENVVAIAPARGGEVIFLGTGEDLIGLQI